MLNKKCTCTTCCVGNRCWDELSSFLCAVHPQSIPSVQASGWITELVFHPSFNKAVKKSFFFKNSGFVLKCCYSRVFAVNNFQCFYFFPTKNPLHRIWACNCPRKMWPLNGCKMRSIWSDLICVIFWFYAVWTPICNDKTSNNSESQMTPSMCWCRHGNMQKYFVQRVLWMPILIFWIHHVSRHLLMHMYQANSLFALKQFIKCLLLG